MSHEPLSYLNDCFTPHAMPMHTPAELNKHSPVVLLYLTSYSYGSCNWLAMGRNQCIDALKHMLRWLMELYGPRASTAPTGAVRIIDVPCRDVLFLFGFPDQGSGNATARAKPGNKSSLALNIACRTACLLTIRAVAVQKTL